LIDLQVDVLKERVIGKASPEEDKNFFQDEFGADLRF